MTSYELPAAGYSKILTAMLSARPLTTDAWVQCDGCKLWRRVPRHVSERLGDNEQWFCNLNNDARFADCEVPQELSDPEIEILLNAQDAAAAATEADDERGGGRGGAKDGADTALNVWHRIHRNIFTHREPKKITEDDIMVCNCVPGPDGTGCGEEVRSTTDAHILFFVFSYVAVLCVCGCSAHRNTIATSMHRSITCCIPHPLTVFESIGARRVRSRILSVRHRMQESEI